MIYYLAAGYVEPLMMFIPHGGKKKIFYSLRTFFFFLQTISSLFAHVDKINHSINNILNIHVFHYFDISVAMGAEAQAHLDFSLFFMKLSDNL